MEELVNKLNYYTELYDAGTPAISDEEWDNLYFKLVKMEKEAGYALPNSPTQSVHFKVVDGLKKVQHNHKMLSLAKTKSMDEVKRFVHGEDGWFNLLTSLRESQAGFSRNSRRWPYR